MLVRVVSSRLIVHIGRSGQSFPFSKSAIVDDPLREHPNVLSIFENLFYLENLCVTRSEDISFFGIYEIENTDIDFLANPI